jgi:hypothetical protein
MCSYAKYDHIITLQSKTDTKPGIETDDSVQDKTRDTTRRHDKTKEGQRKSQGKLQEEL